jgi:hypothetical protein
MAFNGEKSNSTTAETASVRSTSTMSSLKALLHRAEEKKSPAKVRRSLPAETTEERAIRREAAAGYMSMMR